MKELKELMKEGTEYERDELVRKAKKYLDETDWIISKISEAKLLGEEPGKLLEKYKAELKERENCRERINELGL